MQFHCWAHVEFIYTQASVRGKAHSTDGYYMNRWDYHDEDNPKRDISQQADA